MLKDILGQEKLTQNFVNAWKQGKLAQGYILSGPDGVGKTPYAIELAKAFLCRNFGQKQDSSDTEVYDACEKCPSCRKVAHGNHEDILIIEPGDAGNLIRLKHIDTIVNELKYRTRSGERRFVIMREADRMNVEAANHFLKTLEEPPANVTFFLLTARISLMLETIVSRCQVVRMRRATAEAIEQLLIARGVEPQQAKLYSLLADGCPGRAINMEGSGMFERRNLMLERIMQLNSENDAFVASDMIDANKGSTLAATRDSHHADLGLLAILLRDMTLLAEKSGTRLLYNADVADRLQARAARAKPDRLRKLTLETLEARRQIERFVSPELIVSSLMMELAKAVGIDGSINEG